MPIRDLPLEALWKVFLAVDSPYQVYKVFPLVSRHFRDAVLLKSPVVQAQVEVLCDESETNGTLLQPLEIAKLLPTFRKIVVPVNNIFSANDSPLSPEKAQLVKINSPQGVGSISPSTVMLQSVSDDLFSGVALVEQQQMQYVGLERKIQISVGAIPDAPETLVHYLKELLGKGNIQKQSNNLQISQPAAGRLRVSTTIV